MTGLERLRDLVDGMIEWSVYTIMNDDWLSRNGVNACSGRVAMKKLLCEIADQIEREHLREVDDISGRDADAIAWVESHGGVKECDRKVEASMEVGDKYTLLRMELGKMLGYDLMGQLDASDKELVEKIVKRLMPPGMEWPRYEDGEPVELGGEFENAKGNASTLRTVLIKDLRDVLGGDIFWRLGKGANAVELKNGERVKRPAPKVLDADGVPIHEGDTVYIIETGEPVTVNCVEGGNPWFGTTAGTIRHCSKFTHRAPVFAADGVPIKAGDEVWTLDGGGPYTVTEPDPEHMHARVTCNTHDGKLDWGFEAAHITHTKPEPDSWERIEQEIERGKTYTDVCVLSIVRRCKRLAGAS